MQGQVKNRSPKIPRPNIKRIARRQQSFIAIAVAIYAGLWAVDRPADIGSTLIYTLPLCNFIVLVQDHLAFLYRRRHASQSWAIYLGLVFMVAVLGVAVVNVIQFPLHKLPDQTLWQFLASGWKLPFMATMIVGVSTELYRQMRERLEAKNRELQHTLEEEAAERAQHGQELQQAREIQESLLPKEIPQVAGFEIDGLWEPSRVVGGDYYDVIKLSETKLGICIADVVGKSVSAALLMANVQASIRAFATESTAPSDLCKRVNSVLCSTITPGKFVTLFYGVLDSATRTFTYTNAGHLLPILIHRDGRAQELQNGGAVLGVLPAWQYDDSSTELNSGDRLLLFTDGIAEAGRPDGDEFGQQRLISAVREHRQASTTELKAALLADVRKFCNSQFHDDATLMIVSATTDLPAVEDEIFAGASRIRG